jgi:hypothetical protein
VEIHTGTKPHKRQINAHCQKLLSREDNFVFYYKRYTCALIRSSCSLDHKQIGWIIKTPCLIIVSTHREPIKQQKTKMFYIIIISLNVKYLPFHLVKVVVLRFAAKRFPLFDEMGVGVRFMKLMRCA